VHYQYIATRLYIITFLISLTVLTFYILATKEVYQETILKPTEDQFNNLQQMYPSSLSCPCTVISVPYNTIIEIEPFYHQVCSSDMISQSWIDYYNNFQLFIFTSSFDFRANAAYQFQLLATFCEQAQQTVNDSLQLFLQNQFVSSQVISQQIFRSQINESIEEWKSTTLNSFLRPIQLILVTNQGNQLINALHNFQFSFNQITGEFIPIPINYSNCSCARSSTCRTNMGIFSYNWSTLNQIELFRIPNFFTGCLPVESLLESTLECFYDRQCMDTIEYYMNTTTPNFSSLDATRDSPNETVQSILNRLMIDSWTSNVSFSNYYQICAPLSCTYEYTRQHDIFYLISSILGIFAGLSLGIKILIFIPLRFIEKIVDNFSLFGLKKRIRSLFIFRNEQQITNFFHFILLLITLCVLFLISSLTLVTQNQQIMKPSLSTYENLVNDYPNSLQCPCSRISIEYQSFLTIVPRMHQICSSEFVLDDWIDYIYSTIDPLTLNYTDFRRTATGQYQLLASLCELSQQVVDDGLSNLATSNFIDSQLLSSNLLNARIQTIVKDFQTTIPNAFLNSLSFIRQTTGANMLMNMFMTNWNFQYQSVLPILFVFYTTSLDYQECNCGISSKCVQSSQGMMAGCYPLEALLQSTFQCFYNQTCIDSNNTFQALNSSSNESSHYSINTTIESILNKLMVEDYLTNISYENYFSQCKPLWCSYSYVSHRDTIEVTSTLIALYGGLAIIVRVIVILFLKLSLYRKHKVSPQTK